MHKEPLGQRQTYEHLHHRGARWRREQEIENLFEKIMKENFPNLVKEIDIQVQEAQRVSNKIDAMRTILRHTIIKKQQEKSRMLPTGEFP